MGIGYNPIKKKFWLTWVKNNCTIKQYGHLVHTKLRKRKTYCRKTLKKTEAEIVKDEVCVNYYAILATPEVRAVTPPGGWSKPERKPRGTTTTRAKKKSTPPRSLSPPAARKKLLNDQKTKASRFGPLRIRVPAPRKRQPPKQPQRQKRRAKPRAGKSKKNNATLILQRPRDGEEKEKEKEKENDREGEESDADEENIEKHGAFVIDPKKDGKEGPSLVGGGHQKDVHEYIATVSDSESEVDDDPSSDYHPTDEDSSRESAFGELMNVNEMMDALGGSTLVSFSSFSPPVNIKKQKQKKTEVGVSFFGCTRSSRNPTSCRRKWTSIPSTSPRSRTAPTSSRFFRPNLHAPQSPAIPSRDPYGRFKSNQGHVRRPIFVVEFRQYRAEFRQPRRKTNE